MKKKLFYGFILIVSGFLYASSLQAQSMDDTTYIRIRNTLTSLDEEIVGYFPRWTVCEPNIAIKIRQTFNLMGNKISDQEAQTIRVTAAPQRTEEEGDTTFEILLIEVGENHKLISNQIPASISERLSHRTYCYTEIPRDVPPTPAEAQAIISFFEPTNVQHSITLSAFEQLLKIGQTGFWLRHILGTDQVGYHFWEAGEAKVVLQHPLIENTYSDPIIRKAIPYLMNYHIGGGYRVSTGLDNNLLNFLPQRRLNTGPGGKFVGGIDLYAPFWPQFGISTHLELPLQKLENLDRTSIDPTTYAIIGRRDGVDYSGVTNENLDLFPYQNGEATLYLLRATGQVTTFYNWWIDPEHPENFFRFDLGLNYAEVREAGLVQSDSTKSVFIATSGVNGLQTYHPSEFGDWIYFKTEYRHQSTWPFGASLQYSNQMLLARIYAPLFGNWLYLEGKYSTPLRGVRPYEIKDFFMISPVLRLNI